MMLSVEAFYVVTIALFKISLGLFFLRIMIEPLQRRIIHGALVIFTIWSVGYLFFAIFQCGVPSGSRFWHNKLTGRCGSDKLGLGMGYVHAILTAGTDLTFVALPIPMVSRIKMQSREKWIVVSVFGVAIMYVYRNSLISRC
jgi:hypothetical protein